MCPHPRAVYMYMYITVLMMRLSLKRRPLNIESFNLPGSQEFMEKTGKYEVVYIDPIGAILISIYILVNWWRTGHG